MAMPSIGIEPARARANVSAGAVPLWLAALIAAALLGGLDYLVDPHRILKLIGDTDDATRLLQVRGLIAGAAWTDTSIGSIGAPERLVSHWSRLLDLPIAAMIVTLKPMLGTARAETVTRFIWPLLVLWPTLLLIGRETDARGGRRAAYIAIVLGGTAISALMQFVPGRIDHHNVMILGAVAGLMMLVRCMTEPRIGWAAGAALGLGTAIGYEALALTAAGLVITGLYALVSGRGTDGVARAGAAFTALLALALAVTTAPADLVRSHCDALSLNLVLLAASGAAGLGIVAVRGAAWHLPMRLGVPAVMVAAGFALYGLAQPACLKGPFGELDPAIGPLLLDDVIETKSVLKMLSITPATMIVFLITAALGLAAAFKDWQMRRDETAALSLAVLTVTDLAACWQIKLIPYAAFLSVVPIAIAVARLGADETGAAGQMPGWAKRTVAVLGLNQLVLYIVAAAAAPALIPISKPMAAWRNAVQQCIAADASGALAELPAGLAVADRDLGSYIAVKTNLTAAAAPYHRLDKALITTNRIMTGQAEAAEQRLKELGAKYVAVCPGMAGSKTFETEREGDSLRARLMSDRAPAFLEPVVLAKPTPIKVWRVK